jgi:hypothetical protein
VTARNKRKRNAHLRPAKIRLGDNISSCAHVSSRSLLTLLVISPFRCRLGCIPRRRAVSMFSAR